MVYKRGFITNVVVKRSGSNLVSAASIGATELWVGDVFDFDAGGGNLLLESADGLGTVVGYTSVDPMGTHTPGVEPEYRYRIGLSFPLTQAYPIDTPALLWPLAEKKLAYVDLGSEGGNLRVEVPFSMKEKFTQGLREFDDREAVAIDDESGIWQITHVVDEIPSIPVSSIDLDGSGIVIDPTTPPPASPLPIVDSGSGAAVVRWVNADLAIQYDLYVSADDSVAPGPDSLHTINVHSPVWVANMPDGTSLPTDSDVYFALVASNAVGSAAASAWVPGRAGVINDSILSASVAFIQNVISELVETAGLQIGDHTWNETTGLTIPGVVNFPPDAGNASFAQIWAKMIARTLTVEDFLSIRGKNNEFSVGSEIQLGLGVTDPNVAPTIEQYWPRYNDDTIANVPGQGLTAYIAGDRNFVGRRFALTKGGSVPYTTRIYENGSTSHTATWTSDSGWRPRSIARGLNCWWVGHVRTYTEATTVRITKLSNTLVPLFSTDLSVFNMADSGDPESIVLIANDQSPGTLFSGGHVGVLVDEGSTVRYHEFQESGSTLSPVMTSQVGNPSSTTALRGALFQASGGTNPYGTPCLYLGAVLQPTVGVGVESAEGLYVFTHNGSNFVYRESIALAHGFPAKSLMWASQQDSDGAEILATKRNLVGTSVPELLKYSKQASWLNHQIVYTWYDSDPGGSGTQETKASPIRQVTAPTARAWLKITPDPANDTGDPDSPNSHRIYISNTVGGTKRLQGQTTSPTGTFIVGSYSGSSSTTPPATSTFTGQTPAQIQSEKTDGSGPLILLKGDGSGRMGPWSWDDNGVSTLPVPPAVVLYGGGGTLSTLNVFAAIGNWSLLNKQGNITHGVRFITVEEAGWYNINAYMRQDSGTAGRRIASLFYNDIEIVRLGDFNHTGPTAHNGGITRYMEPSDSVDVRVFASAISAFTNGQFSVIRVA